MQGNPPQLTVQIIIDLFLIELVNFFPVHRRRSVIFGKSDVTGKLIHADACKLTSAPHAHGLQSTASQNVTPKVDRFIRRIFNGKRVRHLVRGLLNQPPAFPDFDFFVPAFRPRNKLGCRHLSRLYRLQLPLLALSLQLSKGKGTDTQHNFVLFVSGQVLCQPHLPDSAAPAVREDCRKFWMTDFYNLLKCKIFARWWGWHPPGLHCRSRRFGFRFFFNRLLLHTRCFGRSFAVGFLPGYSLISPLFGFGLFGRTRRFLLFGTAIEPSELIHDRMPCNQQDDTDDYAYNTFSIHQRSQSSVLSY